MFSLWLWYAPGVFLIKFRELHVEHTTRIHLAYTQLTYLSYNSVTHYVWNASFDRQSSQTLSFTSLRSLLVYVYVLLPFNIWSSPHCSLTLQFPFLMSSLVVNEFPQRCLRLSRHKNLTVKCWFQGVKTCFSFWTRFSWNEPNWFSLLSLYKS